MAKTVTEELVVKFTGDVSGLQRSSDRARQAIGGMERAASSAQVALRAMIGTVSVSAIYSAATATLNWADDLGDLAQTLGITTEKVQQLQYAAIANGSSINEVNAALLRFTQAVGDAASSGGPLVDRMKELGIRGLDVNGQLLNLSDLLPQVADAISRASTAQEKLSIATDFFGRQAAPSMVRLLGEGSTKLTELEQAAKDAGAVLSEDVVKAAAETNAKFELLSQTMSVRFKSATLGVIDFFVGIAQKAREAAEAIQYLNRWMVFGDKRPWLDEMYIPTPEERERFIREVNKPQEVEQAITAPVRESNRFIPQTAGRGGNSNKDNRSSKQIASDAVKAISDLEKMSRKAVPTVEGLKRQLMDVDDEIGSMQQTVRNTFSEFVTSVSRGESALDALKRTALDVIGSIAESMISISMGGSSGGGIGGTIASAIGSFFGAGKLGGKIPSFDTGTNMVQRTGLAVVHRGEKITPRRDVAGTSGVTVNQNISISTGVVPTVRAELTRSLPQLRKAAVAGVYDAQMRGALGSA